jgi:hypothetical protein
MVAIKTQFVPDPLMYIMRPLITRNGPFMVFRSRLQAVSG